MRKGGVPVPYIIAVVLGIVVIGVIGYWFFVSSGKFGGAISQTECDAKKLQYCSEWSRVGYAKGSEPAKGWKNYAPNCVGIIDITSVTEPGCRTLLGTTVAGGGGTTSGTCECVNGKCTGDRCSSPGASCGGIIVCMVK